jgi:hypothetical protein
MTRILIPLTHVGFPGGPQALRNPEGSRPRLHVGGWGVGTFDQPGRKPGDVDAATLTIGEVLPPDGE